MNSIQKETPLRILAVTHFPPFRGGSARSAYILFSSLAELGHQVYVLSSITPDYNFIDPTLLNLPSTLTLSRYEVPHFNYNAYKLPPDLDYQEMEDTKIHHSLNKIILNFQPDILIAGHETLARTIPALATKLGIPSVILVRGSPTWRIIEGSYQYEYAQNWIDLFSNATLVITVAEYMRDGLHLLGVTSVQHIPNFLDTNQFIPRSRPTDIVRKLRIQDDDIVVVHASCMQPRKRAHDIIDSAKESLKRNDRLIYVLVGEGDESESLKRDCKKYGISNRFRFPGKVDYSLMPDYLNLSDMVIQPSEGEGMSRVYLETQACGRVLIASDIPPACELITHGETGLLFKLGDVNDLMEKTLYAAGDYGIRKRIGKQSRDQITVHALEGVINQYLITFRNLVNRKM